MCAVFDPRYLNPRLFSIKGNPQYVLQTLLPNKKGLGAFALCVMFVSLLTACQANPDAHFPKTPASVLPTRSSTLLTTLPVHYFVAPTGSDKHSGTSSDQPFQTIQHALQLVQPGDTIYLAVGDYAENLSTQRDGQPTAPITLMGPPNAVLHGTGKVSIAFLVNHDYYTLVGFTIDGLHGDPHQQKSYTDKLLYAQGYQVHQGVTGLHVLNMTFKNAGGECIRLRYFAHQNEIAYSTILNCGRYDFQFGEDGKNGEGIYVGTSSNQWADGKNPTPDADETTENWIHHNTINTQGSECIDIKEGAHNNIVEYNNCSGQRDKDGGGLDARGDNNIFRYNVVYDNLGAGVRLGGHKVNGIEYGKNNEVYGNVIYQNTTGGVNIAVGPQLRICGNQLRDNQGKPTFGNYGDKYKPTVPCEN